MSKFLARIKKAAEHFPGYDHLVLPWHRYQAFRAATKYDYPASGLKVIGVTGTNGKTTTCFMIHRMLTEAGFKTGLMTTVAYGVGKNIKPQLEHMTTVDAKLLNKRIKDIADAGAEYLVLELTSHALSQYRAFGIPIDVAVETNVTHEHLDYHKTMKRYRAAKLKLFKNANNNRDGKKIGIINADDPSMRYFAGEIERPITYGIEKGEIRARQLKLQPEGVDYFIKYDGRKLHIKTQIPGLFNVYNSLATAAVGIIYGLTNKQIEQGIYALEMVEGRMNRIDEGQDFEVIVDFAHSPDAMENIFKSLGNIRGKIITLFGLPGKRDPSNRPLMGKIAGRYSNQIIVTEDDSRDEDLAGITAQIVKGIKTTGNKNFQVVPDRTKAIETAMAMAKKGDIILLLGKGHEKTIIRADGEHPWNEAATARRILKKLF
ncbi:UDP-N-acetylmuramoyl-L-alanyl-D-glutamate--2,6-diaminopimelate ligase [Alphaproteobacteria bacterium]|nr:UDP-N-acetylmuramoyl-L-alanyl-D-glutamate--2,6-diaminopimelate ligase [Alphaproteobacteria bacterium]